MCSFRCLARLVGLSLLSGMVVECLVGCGSSAPPEAASPAAQTTPASPPATTSPQPTPPQPSPPTTGKTAAVAPPEAPVEAPRESEIGSLQGDSTTVPKKPRPAGRKLGELLPADMQEAAEKDRPLKHEPLSPERAAAAGLRRLESQHLVLYTDVPSSPAVDELPQAFDLAVPQWCKYFNVPAEKVSEWKLTGYLMEDVARFRAVEAIPTFITEIANGYQWDDELWVKEQSTDYYRRHLLLHEGTHSFMVRFLGGFGPPWYGEGMAELLATHRWADGRLQLGYQPRDSEEVPGHGRIKILRDDFKAGVGRSLEAVFQYDSQAHLDVKPYGWCWAAASFLSVHPQTRESFREVQAHARDGGLDFTRRFLEPIAADWNAISEDWQLYIAEAEYGYDFERARVRRKASEPLTGAEVRVKIAADAGWQSTGVTLQPGVAYEVAAVGRFQIVGGEPTWWSEPQGVTIRYYRGQPLGMLLGAVRPDSFIPNILTPLANPTPIGRKKLLTPDAAGTLYLKINESPADLADNTGEVLIRIRPAP